jgi:hypothetical protein
MKTQCAACLNSYDASSWVKLPATGYSFRDGKELELRRCECQLTLARDVHCDVQEILEAFKEAQRHHMFLLQQLTSILERK